MKGRPKHSLRRIIEVIGEEFFRTGAVRLDLLNGLPCLLPEGRLMRLRSMLYAALGVHVGRGTVIAGRIRFGVGSLPANLSIGEHCYLNAHIKVDCATDVLIGDYVSIAHDVSIITSDHRIGGTNCRAAELCLKPVAIGNGAWVAAGATILPGSRVGAGAVVAAGAVVNSDIAADTLVGGVPAKFLRCL